MSEAPAPTPLPGQSPGRHPVDAASEEVFGPLAALGGRATVLLGAGGWTCLTLAATTEFPVAAFILFFTGKYVLIGAALTLAGWLMGNAAAGRFEGKYASFATLMRGKLARWKKAVFLLATFFLLAPTLVAIFAPPLAFIAFAVGIADSVQDTLVCEKAIGADVPTGKPAGFDVDGMCARAGYPVEIRPWCNANPDTCAPSP